METLVARPATTVYAGVRRPNDDDAKSLDSLTHGEGSFLQVLQIDNKTIHKDLAATLTDAGVERLDVVVANAGLGIPGDQTDNLTADNFVEILTVNTVGTLSLFQVTWPYLQKSSPELRKFVYITSTAGSLNLIDKQPLPLVGYGASKAAGNFVAKKIQHDYKGQGLKVGILHPGYVWLYKKEDLASQ